MKRNQIMVLFAESNQWRVHRIGVAHQNVQKVSLSFVVRIFCSYLETVMDHVTFWKHADSQ